MFTLLSGKSILVCYRPFGWEDRFCYQSGPLLKSHNGRQALPQETLNLKTGGVPHHKKSLLKTVTLQKGNLSELKDWELHLKSASSSAIIL